MIVQYKVSIQSNYIHILIKQYSSIGKYNDKYQATQKF